MQNIKKNLESNIRIEYKRKLMRGRETYIELSDNFKFGTYAIIATESGVVTSDCINSLHKFLVRTTKTYGGKVYDRVSGSYITYTKKPREVRMGKGKGEIFGIYYRISKGKILFELDGLFYISIDIIEKFIQYYPLGLILKRIC